MTVTETFFTNLAFSRQVYWNPTEFNENPRNDLVADTTSQPDGHNLDVRRLICTSDIWESHRPGASSLLRMTHLWLYSQYSKCFWNSHSVAYSWGGELSGYHAVPTAAVHNAWGAQLARSCQYCTNLAKYLAALVPTNNPLKGCNLCTNLHSVTYNMTGMCV